MLNATFWVIFKHCAFDVIPMMIQNFVRLQSHQFFVQFSLNRVECDIRNWFSGFSHSRFVNLKFVNLKNYTFKFFHGEMTFFIIEFASVKKIYK